MTAFRGSILHCLADPGESGDRSKIEHFEDGLLLVRDGRIAALGPAADVEPTLGPDIEIVDHRGRLIVPGFIDCHVHFPQVDIIASYGEQLMDWLSRYAFPAEERFADAEHAAEVAEFFLDELLANGTTTALVFPTVHPASVDAIFTAAEARNLCLVSGKVMMDRNCPETLRDDPDSAYADSRELLEKWHGRGRLGYAITPRFAVTSSEAQLAAAGRLAAEFPDVHVHTHLAENEEEVQLIARQFAWSRSYFDVYEHFGLARERAVFAHSLHLDEQDRTQMAAHGCSIAFCPTSNLFLGSGHFDLRAARRHRIPVGVGTDVGGGTSLSVLRTLHEAYKVLHVRGQPLPAFRALYLATLGAAEALCLDDRIGNFAVGKEADFVVLDGDAASITARRLGNATELEERLFALIMLGDDRHVAETRVMGSLAYAAG